MNSEPCGIFVVDKPEGITSAKLVARIKRLFDLRKVGHAGTLDPFATGVMVCCINQATKLAQFFLHNDKKYEAVLFLGIGTDTQDATGTVISSCDVHASTFEEKVIYSVFKQFEGKLEQSPPVYSALKHKGVPLYKLARQGNPVQKPARTVFISSLKIRHIHLPEIHFEVSCSGGTYIRTLCADIGEALGCGGHLKRLRRTQSSGFDISEAVTWSEVESASPGTLSERIIPMAEALRNMPVHRADDRLSRKIIHGRHIAETDFTFSDVVGSSLRLEPTTTIRDGFVKVTDINNNLIAVLKKQSKEYHYCCVFQQK